MKPLTTAVVALVAMTGTWTTTTAADNMPEHTPIPRVMGLTENPGNLGKLPRHCTAEAFKPFSAHVWRPQHWKRGQPSQKALRAYRERLRCSQGYPSHHRVIRKTWRHDKAGYYAWRSYKLRWGNCSHDGPVPDCLHGAAETYGADESWMRGVSYCESTWNRYAQNPSGSSGLFQFMPSTWATTPYASKSIWSVKWQSLAGAWMYTQGRSGEWVCEA